MPRTAGCPSCGAALRPDAPWCTLCYTDLRPKPAPEPPPPPPTTAPARAAYGVPAPDPLTQPLVDFLPRAGAPLPATEPTEPAAAGTVWPCTACQAPNPLAEPVCSVCGQPFLAAIRTGGKPLLVLPLVGDVGALGRGQRIGLALGLVVALLIPLALVTMFLTGKPAPAPGATTPGGTPAATQPAAPATTAPATQAP